MDLFIIILLIILIILVLTAIIILLKRDNSTELKKELDIQNSRLRQELNSNASDNLRSVIDIVSKNQNDLGSAQLRQLDAINQSLSDKQDKTCDMFSQMSTQLEHRFQSFALESEQKLDIIRKSVENKLTNIQTENNVHHTLLALMIRVSKSNNLINEP